MSNYIGINGNQVDVNFEKEEQQLVSKYLPKNGKVLELGARYGTVSCVISKVLDNPENHVAVEPDIRVIESLETNKKNNGGKFHIYNGVVSNHGYEIKYVNDEYGTNTVKSDNPSVPNISLVDLQIKYGGIEFDCLVADCEGFVCDFINENMWFLDKLRVIIYEQDGTPWADMIPKYKKLDEILESHSFKLVHTIPHQVYENNKRLHNVWIKE
jgi:FkbM family methyltransferase